MHKNVVSKAIRLKDFFLIFIYIYIYNTKIILNIIIDVEYF